MNGTTLMVLAQTQEETESTVDVDAACGNQGRFCEVLLEWTDNETFAKILSWVLGTPVKIAIIVVLALVANRVLRRVINRGMKKLGSATAEHGEGVVTKRSVERAVERADTIGSLLRSLSAAVVFGTAGIMILAAIGISIVPLIASAGILGLAIGFGAQSVVEDLLRGVFMLAEDQFGVGDRVDVGTVNGYVERITLRTTVIRDPEGTLWHVPNSQIDYVANENQLSSRATVEIGVSYTADLAAAMEVLADGARDATQEPEWQEHVTRSPEVKGVQELGLDEVQIRVVVWVAAGQRRAFERHLRRRLKEALEAAGIEMPNRQVDVWLRNSANAA